MVNQRAAVPLIQAGVSSRSGRVEKSITILSMLTCLCCATLWALCRDNSPFVTTDPMNEAKRQTPQDCPVWSLNPASEKVPLAFALESKLSEGHSVTLEIHDVLKQRNRTHSFGNVGSGYVRLPVIGLRAEAEHNVVVISSSAKCELKFQKFTLHTPSLPSALAGGDFPPLSVKTSIPAKMEPGYTIVVVRRRPAEGRPPWFTKPQLDFFSHWSVIFAMDAEGEVVWYYKADHRISGITFLKDGSLFMLPDRGGVSQVIDMMGTTLQTYYAANRPEGPPPNAAGGQPVNAMEIHHMPHEMPNGNLLMMTANVRDVDWWYTSEVDPKPTQAPAKIMADRIVEITRQGVEVWAWDAFDYLPHHRIGYESLSPYLSNRGFPDVADWTHGNGVDFDEHDNAVILSFRIQDAFIKIDYATKKIKWIMGPHAGWGPKLQDKLLKPIGNTEWTWHGHNPHPSAHGTVMVYDNDIFQGRPFTGKKPPHRSRSRAMEYKIDEERMEVEQIWSSTDPCISWAMGDAYVLPLTNNRLVIDAFCQVPRDDMPKSVPVEDLDWDLWDRAKFTLNDLPMHGRIREYHGLTSEVVFEAEVRDKYDLVTYEIFNGMRIRDLYGEV